MFKKFAFTLAEILIAMAIIGIVAAMTIPNVMLGQQTAQSKARFKTAYSQLSRAIGDMQADGISTNPNSYANANSFYNVLKSYSKVVVDCGTNRSSTNTSACPTQDENVYRTFDGNSKMSTSFQSNGAFVTNNGMLFMIYNPENNPLGLIVTVDTNGKNKLPNRWGWDTFSFEIIRGDVVPVGTEKSKESTYKDSPQNYCVTPAAANVENGITCSYYAASNDDYFKDLYKNK